MSSRLNRFTLVYEPMYSTSHIIIDFKINPDQSKTIKTYDVERFKGIIESRKGKHSLLDIDKFTCDYSNSCELAHDASIYGNMRKIFISLPIKGFVNKINPVFNNPELKEKFSLVKEGFVDDKKQIAEFTDMLLDFNSSFYTFFLNSELYKSKTFISLLKEVRYYNSMMRNCPDLETSFIFNDKKKLLKLELSKYHHFREVFLAKQAYDKTQEEKKEDFSKVKVKKIEKPFFTPYEAEEQYRIKGFPII